MPFQTQPYQIKSPNSQFIHLKQCHFKLRTFQETQELHSAETNRISFEAKETKISNLKVFFLENPIKIKPNTVEYNHGLIKLNPPILTLLTTGNKKGNAISSTELSWKLKSYIPCINKQKFILYTHQSNIIINTIIHNVSLISPRKLKAKKKKKTPAKVNFFARKN